MGWFTKEEYDAFRKSINISLMDELIKSVTITQSGKGISAGDTTQWEFSIRKDEEFKFQSEVTDYALEDNYSLQDNIAIKPIEFTVNGIVGEKETSASVLEQTENLVGQAISLVGVTGYKPEMVTEAYVTALQGVQTAVATYQTAQEVASSVKHALYGVGDDEVANQKTAYNFIYSAWKSREIFDVDTPYGTLHNYVIASASIKQPESTRFKSEVSITFKELNFINTGTASNSEGYAGDYKSSETVTGGNTLKSESVEYGEFDSSSLSDRKVR